MKLHTLLKECRENPNHHVSIKGPLEVGILLVRRARSFLALAAIRYGIEVQWSEAKGWLESEFIVITRGPTLDVARFWEDFDQVMR